MAVEMTTRAAWCGPTAPAIEWRIEGQSLSPPQGLHEKGNCPQAAALDLPSDFDYSATKNGATDGAPPSARSHEVFAGQDELRYTGFTPNEPVGCH